MKLRIELPNNLNTAMILESERIPCVALISHQFCIEFSNPLFNSRGTVEEWDIEDINARSPAGAGGKYLHYVFAMVSLGEKIESKYQITHLEFFVAGLGWTKIVEAGELVSVGSFFDKDES